MIFSSTVHCTGLFIFRCVGSSSRPFLYCANAPTHSPTPCVGSTGPLPVDSIQTLGSGQNLSAQCTDGAVVVHRFNRGPSVTWACSHSTFLILLWAPRISNALSSSPSSSNHRHRSQPPESHRRPYTAAAPPHRAPGPPRLHSSTVAPPCQHHHASPHHRARPHRRRATACTRVARTPPPTPSPERHRACTPPQFHHRARRTDSALAQLSLPPFARVVHKVFDRLPLRPFLRTFFRLLW